MNFFCSWYLVFKHSNLASFQIQPGFNFRLISISFSMKWMKFSVANLSVSVLYTPLFNKKNSWTKFFGVYVINLNSSTDLLLLAIQIVIPTAALFIHDTNTFSELTFVPLNSIDKYLVSMKRIFFTLRCS